MSKVIGSSNVDEGVRATSSFVGLLHRIIKECGITNDQTAYLPHELDWKAYLTATVQYEAQPDVDQELLRLGAMVAAVSWLHDVYNEENYSDEMVEVERRLGASEFGKTPEVTGFIRAGRDPEKSNEYRGFLSAIYRNLITRWWVTQLAPEESPKASSEET